MRADQLLVQQGLAPTRSAAQRLIERGAVRWLGPQGWKVPKKAGEELPEGCELELTDDAELRWASRGGLKLEGVLRDSGLSVAGAVALDVGQSTGGFTDVLLSAGAAHVVGVDVGHGQLHESLRIDRQLIGRTARQGQPGSAQFFLCLEDHLIATHAPALTAEVALKASPDGELPASVARHWRTIQRKVEALHCRQRRALAHHHQWINELKKAL